MNNLRQFMVDIAIIISVPILALGVYFLWLRDPAGPLLSVGSEELKAKPDDPGVTTTLALQTLRTITLNDALFQDPSFQSLVLYTVDIPSSDLSRKYPFTPTTEIADMLNRKTGPVKSIQAGVKTESLPSKLDVLKKSATR